MNLLHRRRSRGDSRYLRRSSLSVEALEARQLMAGDIYYNYTGEEHGIHLDGTSGNDFVVVSEDHGRIKVETSTAGGKSGVHYFELDRDQSNYDIYFHGGKGKDVFINLTRMNTYAWGGEGRDILIGGHGYTELWGNDDNDTLIFSEANVALAGYAWGGEGDDTIISALNVAHLKGGAGRDFIHGGSAGGFLYGEGDDDFLYAHGGAGVYTKMLGGGGNDWMVGSDGEEEMIGGLNDNVAPGIDDDFMFGGRGYDILLGGGGRDYLDGGADDIADALIGQFGADTFRVHYTTIGGNSFVHEDNAGDYKRSEGDVYRTRSDVDLGAGLTIGLTYLQQWAMDITGMLAMSNDAGASGDWSPFIANYEYYAGESWSDGANEDLSQERIQIALVGDALAWQAELDIDYFTPVDPYFADESLADWSDAALGEWDGNELAEAPDLIEDAPPLTDNELAPISYDEEPTITAEILDSQSPADSTDDLAAIDAAFATLAAPSYATVPTSFRRNAIRYW